MLAKTRVFHGEEKTDIQRSPTSLATALVIPPPTTPLTKRLEELEETTDGGNGQDKRRIGAEEDAGVIFVVTVLPGALVGVLVVAPALELAVDAVLQLLELAASVVDVLRALDVQGALDRLERGELDSSGPQAGQKPCGKQKVTTE